MDRFIQEYSKNVSGTLFIADRVIFKGYLPISYPQAAEKFLGSKRVLLKDFSSFTKKQTKVLCDHAEALAKKHERPYEYLREKIRKEEYARSIAERDGITKGLVCILSCNEENHSFGLRYGSGRPVLVRNKPRSLTLYYYYIDTHFGLMHIRISCWLPFQIQVYINGHEWLKQEMDRKGMAYEMLDNAFTWIEDAAGAQKLADKFAGLPFENILHCFARRINPLMKTILDRYEYYWVTDQAEFSTDVMVHSASWLKDLFCKWQKFMVAAPADDILNFLGRKLRGSFNSSIVADVDNRPAVTRIKHSVNGNSIKMYNKHGIVLRVETTINRPKEFRLFEIGRGNGAGKVVPMKKGVADFPKYAKVGLRANQRYLDSLSVIHDTHAVEKMMDTVAKPVHKKGKICRALNLFSPDDQELFKAVLDAKGYIHGFKSCDIGEKMGIKYSHDAKERRKQSSYVYRKLLLLKNHGLITKYGKSRRYHITPKGEKILFASVNMKNFTIEYIYNKVA